MKIVERLEFEQAVLVTLAELRRQMHDLDRVKTEYRVRPNRLILLADTAKRDSRPTTTSRRAL